MDLLNRQGQQATAVLHSVMGIRTEIHENLLHPGFVCQDNARLLGHLSADFNTARQGGPEQLERFLHDLPEIDRSALRIMLAGVVQNLTDHVLGPVRSFQHLLEMGLSRTVTREVQQRHF